MNVFISHTSELANHPTQSTSFVRAAVDAVLTAKHQPIQMESFTAENTPSADVCRNKVLEADIYVGIIGFRFGSLVRGSTSWSYTQLEYETAKEAHAELLLFLLSEEPNVALPRHCFFDPEHNDLQEQFRSRIKNAPLVFKTFKNPDELKSQIIAALGNLPREQEASAEPAHHPERAAAAPHRDRPQAVKAKAAGTVGVLFDRAKQRLLGMAWPIKDRIFITDAGCAEEIDLLCRGNGDVVLRWPADGNENLIVDRAEVWPRLAGGGQSQSQPPQPSLGAVMVDEHRSHVRPWPYEPARRFQVGERLQSLACPMRDARNFEDLADRIRAIPVTILGRDTLACRGNWSRTLIVNCDNDHLMLGGPIVDRDGRVVAITSMSSDRGYVAVTPNVLDGTQ